MKTSQMGPSGQSILEFLCVLPLFLFLLGGGALLLRKQWNQTRCIYQAFQAAHHALRADRLEGGILGSFQGVKLEETSAGIIASAVCGSGREQVSERVQLPKLESARW